MVNTTFIKADTGSAEGLLTITDRYTEEKVLIPGSAGITVTNGTDEVKVTPTTIEVGGIEIGAAVSTLGAEIQADSIAVDVAGIVADFNALLAKLRTAKVLAV